MKYGIYFAYWEKEWNVDQKKYISKVKDLGFDILEISCAMLKNISKNELLEMKKMAEDAGVMLTAGYGPNAKENLGSSDPEVVKNAIAFYTDILKKLEILDIHTIGGGIYSYWPVDYSKPIDKAGDWARSVANVRTVGKIAGECGVEYCLEVLNRFEGYLLNTCAEAKQFVEEVDVPAVKIMLDTFHMNIEEDDMVEAAKKIHEMYHCAVLCKGGHSLNDANDLLYQDGEATWFHGKRINNPNTHGTGCTLSSAIASNLAKGYSLEESIHRAKEYISGALEAMLDLGKGSGPMDHGFEMRGRFSI